MGKYMASTAFGVVAGITALGFANKEDTSAIFDGLSNDGPATQIEVGRPTTSVEHLAAFAVGKISGVITVVGSYDKTRWGPAPNCNVDISMELPFIAEPIVELKDLEITTSTPDASGGINVTARLTDDVKVLNPRTILRDPVVEHSGNGFGQMCDEENYDTLINTMWEVGGKATNTAAECLVSSVNTQYVTDTAGNRLQTDSSAEIQQIYKDDLTLALQALYPNARTVDVIFPEPNPNYNISQSESYKELAAAIAETDDDKYDINTEAVETCTFESLSLDVTPTDGT